MADDKDALVEMLLQARKQLREGGGQPDPDLKIELEKKPAKEPEIETKRLRWAHDPDVQQEIHGMKEGGRFELSDCGPDLDGVWRVVTLNLADPSPLERHLYAEREAKPGPPYIKMSEDAVREELHEGRLKVIEKGLGKAAPARKA